MRNVAKRISDVVYQIFGSQRTFNTLMCLFVLQAAWLAFTAIYPLPFDEYAHVGAIQFYAKQWSWVVISQPIESGIIGDLTREPSFLYRWLMSFPYRILIQFLTFYQTIIAMRLMNVTMVAGGIVLFRRLLMGINFSNRMINIILLAFIMTPTVPFLAAHVNYDNMMFFLAPIVFIYALKVITSNKNLLKNIAMFLFTGLAAVLTKQTFLPLMMITTIYLCITVIWRNRSKSLSVLVKSWQTIPKNFSFFVFVIAFLLMFVLGVERYGINLVRHGTHSPKCETVQPIELCEKFGPWYRNKVINVTNRPAEPPYGNPVSFSQYWITRMMRGYFAIFQHTPTKVVSDKEPFGPIEARPLLPLPIIFATFVAIFGVAASLAAGRRIWRDKNILFIVVIIAGFMIIQWLYNYQSYLRMWKAEAIQARYTYPILILIFAVIAWSTSKVMTNKQVKSYLVIAMLLCYVWGGGIAGWLIRADESWRWQTSMVQMPNRYLQNILRLTVIH